ncbi:hypothetical protein GCM10007036_14000 [Alsobacter metallidurans]|uniref:Uncharacterized protein n=1 Tax=Alsobacter metallidurans TaxID=340221 RepID=A0A917MH22_9HYPH|nr:hypothetical protein [Alsobacter metallidurans]GGH14584.1 hypothetical protein GCM10007036_14000 [Alsobacter metallidurans]
MTDPIYRPQPALLPSAADLKARLIAAKTGDVFIYHHGFLSADREHCATVHAIGQTASKMAELGHATLRQRKLRNMLYAYELRVTTTHAERQALREPAQA